MAKWKAGIQWDSILEKLSKDMGENKHEIGSIGECGGYKIKVRA